MAKMRRVQKTYARYIVSCERCGKEYWGRRSTAQYCSNACKQAAYRDKKAALEEAKKQQPRLF